MTWWDPSMVNDALRMTGSLYRPESGSNDPAAEQGKKNQQQALGKIGSAIGAVANFYTGNWAGAAQSVAGMAGTAEDQEERKAQGGGAGSALGFLGKLFGGA